MYDYVIVHGVAGLGNNLFQLATAIYYKEKLGYKELLMKDSNILHFGSALYEGRVTVRKNKNGDIVSYKDNIFSKLKFSNLEGIDYEVFICDESSTEFFHGYNSKVKYYQGNNNVCIHGYCQNYLLFYEVMEQIPKYLNLEDEEIIQYIKEKYSYLFCEDKKIMMGLRIGCDFSGYKPISNKNYINAFNYLTGNNYNEKIHLVVITDNIENCKEYLSYFYDKSNINIHIINEDDIVQIYIGLLCDDFILSNSTYHYWIALLKYIKNKTSKVIYFNNTDIVYSPIALPEWIKLEREE